MSEFGYYRYPTISGDHLWQVGAAGGLAHRLTDNPGTHGLGPLIGTRTWGGVVGIWPQQSLVDGTVTTQPEFSTWFLDVGFQVENYGTEPDIEVEIGSEDYRLGRDPQLERGIAELLRLTAEPVPVGSGLPTPEPRRHRR